MTSVYLDSCPSLPVDRPYGFPHLVESGDQLRYALEAVEGRSKIHVADGVATVLYNYSPQVLNTFLDLNCDRFSFMRYETDTSTYDLCIERESDLVTCGLFKPNGRWDFRCVYRISPSGMWIPQSGLGTLFGVRLFLVAKDEESDKENRMNMGDFGLFFAASLIWNKKWKYLPGVTITASYGEKTRTLLADTDPQPESTT